MMSEMLDNHYFQLRNLILAESTYENLPQNQFGDFNILKKLIICYTQTNKLDKALELLFLLIKKDINTILNSNSKDEDCPCNDLITKIETGEITYSNRHETLTALGILHLYCNYKNSIKYFKMAIKQNSNKQLLNEVYKILKITIQKNILQTNKMELK